MGCKGKAFCNCTRLIMGCLGEESNMGREGEDDKRDRWLVNDCWLVCLPDCAGLTAAAL